MLRESRGKINTFLTRICGFFRGKRTRVLFERGKEGGLEEGYVSE